MTFRMKGRRAVLVALCSGALCAIPMLAQDAAPASPPPQGQMGPRGGGGRGQLEMLTKRLNLTSDQQTQVKAIDEDSGNQMMAVRNDTSLSQDDKRSKMMDIRKASQDKIRAVLTDDQKTKYDALLAEMRDRMKERGQGAPPPPPQ
jgi:Spy/CpxP family protein refolding chaperone